MAKIIVVRHGESTGNQRRFVSGQNDYPLSYLGVRQSVKLWKELRRDKHIPKDKRLITVVTSPLQRACTTAYIVASLLGLKSDPEVWDDLQEIDYGFSMNQQLPSRYKSPLEACLANDPIIDSWEGLTAVHWRAIRVVRVLYERFFHSPGLVLVFGHNTFNSCIFAVHNGATQDELLERRRNWGVMKNSAYREFELKSLTEFATQDAQWKSLEKAAV